MPACGRAKVTNVTFRVLIAAAIATCLSGGSAFAQSTPSLYERESSSQPPSNKLPELLTEIGLDQRLNAQVPLALPRSSIAGGPPDLTGLT